MLVTAAIGRAFTTVKERRIAIEINQLGQSLQMFKEKYGEYPPDFSSPTLVLSFLAGAFPKYYLNPGCVGTGSPGAIGTTNPYGDFGNYLYTNFGVDPQGTRSGLVAGLLAMGSPPR